MLSRKGWRYDRWFPSGGLRFIKFFRGAEKHICGRSDTAICEYIRQTAHPKCVVPSSSYILSLPTTRSFTMSAQRKPQHVEPGSPFLQVLANRLRFAKKIVSITGAGISTAAGLRVRETSTVAMTKLTGQGLPLRRRDLHQRRAFLRCRFPRCRPGQCLSEGPRVSRPSDRLPADSDTSMARFSRAEVASLVHPKR